MSGASWLKKKLKTRCRSMPLIPAFERQKGDQELEVSLGSIARLFAAIKKLSPCSF